MLFNSYAFIFLFLPVILGGFRLLWRWNVVAVVWLIAASLFFYAWWRLWALPILLGSALFNYGAGYLLLRRSNRSQKKIILAAAITGDLTVLAYFKYAGFLAANACGVLSVFCAKVEVLLPIGISFFTFTQIAYLVDIHRGKVKASEFAPYLLFVTYFPHLIAGPILHHSEMIPQFRALGRERISAENIAVGLSVFIVGLFKKVCLADSVAVLVPPVFDAAGGDFSRADAWVAAIAYTVQIYFDFSGYTDMALGMSYLFGIRLPINFNSPYQALSIIDFWRRWHMTLSAFLRDYLYIPLGGNRHGTGRRYANLMATMLLGGLWHGSAWTFVIWGGLHGLYLVVNHAWRHPQRRARLPELPHAVAWGLTMLAVVVAWVFFRAPNLGVARRILGRMFGSSAGGAELHLASAEAVSLLAILTLVAALCPNLQQFISQQYCLHKPEGGALGWTPSVPWAGVVALLAIVSVIFISRQSVFLYFQF
jgi:alginate O-acetyltransferase complex protein AlgI